MLWLPLPDSVTPVLQLPSLPTVAVPSAVVLPLSNSVTVVPASATSTVPVMVCAAWLVLPPLLPIATTGAVVSRMKLNAAVVELLPATSLNCAVTDLVPSAPRSPAVTVRLTLPALMSAAVMVWVTGCASADPPSSNCTVSPTAMVGLSATVKLGAVTLVRLSVLDIPESDAAVRSGAPPAGAVVSSVMTSAAVVELLPATSLNCAVIDFEPSAPR
ncbi:MAG: hypothetical protein ABI407_20270, partial [Bradyrhizobium sp.]